MYLSGMLDCNKPLQVSPKEPGPTILALGEGSCSGETVLDFILWPSLKRYIPGWSLSSDLEFWLLRGPRHSGTGLSHSTQISFPSSVFWEKGREGSHTTPR